MKTKTISYLCAAVFCLGLFWTGIGCDQPDVEDGKGTLIMNITDAPDENTRISLKKDDAEEEEYEQVYITFIEISVHKADADNETDGDDDDNETDNSTEAAFAGIMAEDNETNSDASWIIISSDEQGFDLKQLQDGAFDLLAQEELDAGKYTQVRLKITDEDDANGEPKTYVMVEGEKYKLTVPSGTKSGLKLTKGFTITAGQETVLYLDFDAQKSVNKTGSGKYQMKPTIKIRDTAPESSGGDDNETETSDGDNETKD
jgi:hypothetical protein